MTVEATAREDTELQAGFTDREEGRPAGLGRPILLVSGST